MTATAGSPIKPVATPFPAQNKRLRNRLLIRARELRGRVLFSAPGLNIKKMGENPDVGAIGLHVKNRNPTPARPVNIVVNLVPLLVKKLAPTDTTVTSEHEWDPTVELRMNFAHPVVFQGIVAWRGT